jgi:cobalamin biosynthesis protein CbiD
MSSGVTPSAFATLAVLSFLACGGARQETSVPEPARPVSSTSNVLTATCRSMSYDDSTMDVITGLSFSLRVVTFQVNDDTEVVIRGERGELSDLAPGKVVRIHYRKTPQGNEADRIEEVLDPT